MDNKTPEAENAHPIILKQSYNYRLADESDGMFLILTCSYTCTLA